MHYTFNRNKTYDAIKKGKYTNIRHHEHNSANGDAIYAWTMTSDTMYYLPTKSDVLIVDQFGETLQIFQLV